MVMIRFRSLNDKDIIPMTAGHHYVDVALNEVLIFIRKDKALPMGVAAQSINGVSTDNFTMYHAEGDHGEYIMYTDETQTESIKF
jgi:alpha-glucosidase